MMRRRHALRTIVTGAGGVGCWPAAGAALPQSASRGRPPFVDCADGTRLSYKDWGTGRQVVFAAPWALNADWWDHQITYLSGQGVRCIAYDRRGHGRSTEPGRGYDFDTLADDLASLIDQLDLRRVVLVGHSVGAGEVVRYISRHGASRVAGAVLIAPITPFILKTADNPDGADASALEQGRGRLMEDGPQRIADAAPAFFGAPAIRVQAETMAWWTRMMVDQCSMSAKLALHRSFTETDFRGDLARMTLPTLIIHGDNDQSALIDRTGRPTHRLISGSAFTVYEGAAHGLTVTHAARLNRDLLTFIQRHA